MQSAVDPLSAIHTWIAVAVGGDRSVFYLTLLAQPALGCGFQDVIMYPTTVSLFHCVNGHRRYTLANLLLQSKRISGSVHFYALMPVFPNQTVQSVTVTQSSLPATS